MFPAHRILLLVALCLHPALCLAAERPANDARAANRPTGNATALISLLLPLDAPEFAAAAGAVLAGCNAAFSLFDSPARLEVLRTDASAAQTVEAWSGAERRGSDVIVGPLLRNAVTALAQGLLSRPSSGATGTARPFTLALNTADDVPRLPERFYVFALAIEQEARAIARAAWVEGHRSAVVLQGPGALDRRAALAFTQEWTGYGGRVAPTLQAEAIDNPETLREHVRRLDTDLVFLATDAATARRVRPYLGSDTPIYATSQVNDAQSVGGGTVDLTGIRFVDMPWLLQPDHPAVMVYRRNPSLSTELQRLYGFGIDACRIAVLIAQARTAIDIDGVTGRLILHPGGDASPLSRSVAREPAQASFLDRSTAFKPPPTPPETADEAPGTAPVRR